MKLLLLFFFGHRFYFHDKKNEIKSKKNQY